MIHVVKIVLFRILVRVSIFCSISCDLMGDNCVGRFKQRYSGSEGRISSTIGLHQGFALSPFLFVIVMDELTRAIRDEIPWCMLFWLMILS